MRLRHFKYNPGYIQSQQYQLIIYSLNIHIHGKTNIGQTKDDAKTLT